MQTDEKVLIATYEHKHGSDSRVFKTTAGAWRWRTDIAVEWWDHEMSDLTPKPDDPEQVATAYWSHMEDRGHECFNIQEADLEE